MIDVDEAYVGRGHRGARVGAAGACRRWRRPATGAMRLEYLCPSRGLIGYRSQFLTDTRGTGILNHNFNELRPVRRADQARAPNGVLIVAGRRARPTPTASSTCRSAGSCSSGRRIKVYGGQIIGLHSRDNDLVVNPSKAKKLTNIRTTAADEKLFLTPPRVVTLEAALEFINDDELVEVTPKAIRLRKRVLDHNERKASREALGHRPVRRRSKSKAASQLGSRSRLCRPRGRRRCGSCLLRSAAL